MTRIGVLQTCTGIDPAANAKALVAGVARLAAEGALIVFTPEMSGLLDRDRARAAANISFESNDLVLEAVRRAAADHGVWVQLGSLAVRREDGDGLGNRAFLIDADGGVVARYDKIHLFDVDLGSGESYRESNAYRPGDRAVVTATPWFRIGLTICYDVRFPLLYNDLARAGAELLAVPAAFTRQTGAAHWHALLRSRAIETGCFVVAAAQTGVHADGRETYGHALVVDPWGTVVLDLEDHPAGAVCDIDLSHVVQTRRRVPALENARSFVSALTDRVVEPRGDSRAPVAQPDRATVS